jgi:hypothetical protein
MEATEIKYKIDWIEQDKLFGLDYSSKKGTYKDFTFDIRYDYCGDSKIKPDCGCCLLIYFKNVRIENKFGNIKSLTNYSEEYLKETISKYI